MAIAQSTWRSRGAGGGSAGFTMPDQAAKGETICLRRPQRLYGEATGRASQLAVSPKASM